MGTVKQFLRKVFPVRTSSFNDFRDQYLRESEAIRRTQDVILQKLDLLLAERFVSREANFKLMREVRTLEAQMGALKRIVYRAEGQSKEDAIDDRRRRALSEMEEIALSPQDNRRRICHEGSDHDAPSLIVSLTSYPARIDKVHKTIESLLSQTMQPDEIILWLSYEEFPFLEDELPKELLDLEKDRFKIRWCDNLGPHKKYYYTMLENPEAIVITVDDDMYYDADTVEVLYKAHERHPLAVCARRARRIEYGADGLPKPYWDWHLYDHADETRIDLLSTGVGGVLYPPYSMSELLFDKSLILELCFNCDDLWLKTMQLIQDTPVVLSDTSFHLNPIETSQDVSLYQANLLAQRNDEVLQKIRETLADRYPNLWMSPTC